MCAKPLIRINTRYAGIGKMTKQKPVKSRQVYIILHLDVLHRSKFSVLFAQMMYLKIEVLELEYLSRERVEHIFIPYLYIQ